MQYHASWLNCIVLRAEALKSPIIAIVNLMARRNFHCSANQNARNKRRGNPSCYNQGDIEKTLKGIEPIIVELKPLNYGKLMYKTRDDLGHLLRYNWLVSRMALFGAIAEKSWFKSQVRWLVRMSVWSTQDLQFWVRTAALSEKWEKSRGWGLGQTGRQYFHVLGVSESVNQSSL